MVVGCAARSTQQYGNNILRTLSVPQAFSYVTRIRAPVFPYVSSVPHYLVAFKIAFISIDTSNQSEGGESHRQTGEIERSERKRGRDISERRVKKREQREEREEIRDKRRGEAARRGNTPFLPLLRPRLRSFSLSSRVSLLPRLRHRLLSFSYLPLTLL